MNEIKLNFSVIRYLKRTLQIVLGSFALISFCVYSQQNTVSVNAGWNLLGNGIS